MKLQVKNKNNNEILFTGTKQDCMHFIKRRAIDRHEIKIESVKVTEPIESYTTTSVEEPKKGFFTRIWNK